MRTDVLPDAIDIDAETLVALAVPTGGRVEMPAGAYAASALVQKWVLGAALERAGKAGIRPSQLSCGLAETRRNQQREYKGGINRSAHLPRMISQG